MSSRSIFGILVAASLTFLGCQKEASSSGAASQSAAPAVTENPSPMAFLDAPAEGAVVGPTLSVIGWALDPSGIAEVSASVDQQSPSAAAIGLAHPGVAEAHPGISGNDHAGFAVQISGLKDGSHSLLVTITARGGGKTEIRRQFTVR